MYSKKIGRLVNCAAIALAIAIVVIVAGCNPTGHFTDITTLLGQAVGGLGI